MSSQHQLLATLWEQLLGRDDISAVLHEIIGRHALQPTFQQEQDPQTSDSYQTIVWIKAIYDLQRTYLSATTTSSTFPPELQNTLLPPELLYSSVLHLVGVKDSLLSSVAVSGLKEITRFRHVFALAVLSGLRLLLLHSRSISTYQKVQLQSTLRTAWKDDQLDGAERFLVQHVFAALTDTLRDPDHVDAYLSERASAQLPTYTSGLYPLHVKPETCITPLIHAMAEEDEDWVDAYLLMYDILWAVECAITQRYVDLRIQHGALDLASPIVEDDEIFEQLNHQRSSLIVSIFHFKGTMKPSSTLLESLAITLLAWDQALDSFLDRQDSLIQNRMSLPYAQTRHSNFGQHIESLQPYLNAGMVSFMKWLTGKDIGRGMQLGSERDATRRSVDDAVEMWVGKMATADSEVASATVKGHCASVYVVSCPKLHAIPKRALAYHLRWNDKFAYENLQEGSPFLNWKEGVPCPSCSSGEKIKSARLLEPLQSQQLSNTSASHDTYSQSQYSGDTSSSVANTTVSTASRSLSDGGSVSVIPGTSTMNVCIPTTISHSYSDPEGTRRSDTKFTQFESPISPISSDLLPRRTFFGRSATCDSPISPLAESLNIPIAIASSTSGSSRLSMNLPIPVLTPPLPEVSNIRPDTLPGASHISWSETSLSKAKQPSKSSRFASSMRRKSSFKEQQTAFSKDTRLAFSATGRSLVLWSRAGDVAVRFELPSNGSEVIQGCNYQIGGIRAVAMGDRKCAMITIGDDSATSLTIFHGLSKSAHSAIELEVPGRPQQYCIAVSKDDRYVAFSVGNQIILYSLENGLKRLSIQNQGDVYELHGGLPVTKTTADESTTDSSKSESNSWFSTHSRNPSLIKVADEQSQPPTVVSRQLYFSPDSQRLVVATQHGDHTVHVDVWDVTREPVGTISEHSRTFRLPPWVLNDGDLTGVFYDSVRRAALVTAFLSKEYPVLIPFPGYGPLLNETFSTKIVSATQSPSGSIFIIANAMTEIIQFEWTAKGTMSPRKLKKASSKISNSVFKPGAIALAMPTEDILQVFWVKDGKCMLRTIKLGITETVRDTDIRPHYDRVMSLKERPVARAPSVHVPELDA